MTPMHANAKPQSSSEHEESRDSMRPIRALNRGLQLLAQLNRLDRAAINTLAHAARLPRTTTYRILETLRLAGYVERDPHDDCYRPTIMVRGLSAGFDDAALLSHVARPHLAALGAKIVWPLAIATRSSTSMIIRAATDHQSPLALERYSAGARLPMLASAAGRAYLAYCTPPERDGLLAEIARSALPADRPARNRLEVERLLDETRSQGFGVAQRPRRVCDETSIAVPVLIKERVHAAVTVRFAATALALRTAVDQFVPKMRDLAQRIEREIAEPRGAA